MNPDLKLWFWKKAIQDSFKLPCGSCNIKCKLYPGPPNPFVFPSFLFNSFPILMCNTNFAGILCISSRHLWDLSHCNVHHAGIFSRYAESLGSICFFSRYTSVPQVLTSITVPVSAVWHTWLRLINNPEQSVNIVGLVLSVSQSQITSDTLWKEICSQVTGEMSFGLCPSLPIHI